MADENNNKITLCKNVEGKIEVSRQITERFCCGYLIGRYEESKIQILDLIELDLTLFENFDVHNGPSDAIQAEFACIRASFPVGLNIVGVFITQPENGNIEVAQHLIRYLKQIEDIVSNPSLNYTVCLIKPSHCDWHIADSDGNLNSVNDVSTINMDISGEVLFRVQKKVTVSYLAKSVEDSSFDGLDIMSSVNSRSAFLIEEIRAILFDNDEGQVIGNISCTDIVKDVQKARDIKTWPESTKPLGNVINVTNLVRMSFDASKSDSTLDMNSEDEVDKEIGCSVPVLLSKRISGQCVTIKVNIDALVIAPLRTPAPKLLFLFRDAIYRQSTALHSIMRHNNKVYEPFHFLTSTQSVFPITTLIPSNDHKGKILDENSTTEYRRSLHKRFFVVVDRPVFKKSQSVFAERKLSSYHLINPHRGLNIPDIEGDKVALVDGRYAYHHYTQENFDDGHWGCAYRSLQTLASWFWLQGYTERRFPTHEEIQKALVKIGDKEANFVGSREWIGSMEVSYCLDELFGITSKTLHVSTGADLSYKGRDLYQHFKTQGTPVMIGGGVLAHTIVGVVFNENTGETRFLIVDPHFTGNDNLKTVQSKGWVGWKGQNFWNQTAHYNMCMPQRPKCI